MIDAHRDEYGVEPICRVLQVAPSTYYARRAREREPSARAESDARLLEEIRRVHEAGRGRYGARKVWLQLRREGIEAAKCTVERLMAREGLAGAVRGKRPRATAPGEERGSERPPDLLERDFSASAPSRRRVADGDAYDNALAETTIGLYKAEVIHLEGPWRSFEQVELATLEWVDWYNSSRLHGACGGLPPAE